MSWQVSITINDSVTYNLHDFSGENLLRDEGITKTVQLHKDLKPVQDTANVLVEYRLSLATALLGITDPISAVVEINKDGAAWFTGYLRPLTEIVLEDDQTIELEIVDTTELFKQSFATGVEVAAGVVICDPVTTTNSLLHILFNRPEFSGKAGATTFDMQSIPLTPRYVSDDLEDGTPVYSNAPWYFSERETVYDQLVLILQCYRYVFYADETGQFRTYDVSPSSITSTATVSESAMIGSLKVNRQLQDNDGVEITPREVADEIGKQIFATDWLGKFGYRKDNRELSQLYSQEYNLSDGTSGIDSAQERILSVSNKRADLYYNRRPGAPYNWYRNLALPYDNTADTGTSGVVYFDCSPTTIAWRFRCETWPGREVTCRDAKVYADVVYTRKADARRYPTNAVRPVKIDAPYIYNDADSNAFASLHNTRFSNSLYEYAFKSEALYAVGQYVTISNLALNASVTARIVKVKATSTPWPIYSYVAESVAATVPIFTAVVASPAQAATRIAAAPAGLGTSGDVISQIQGNLLDPSFSPSETGLYFSEKYLGFWDNDASDWLAIIRNDGGTGKAYFGNGSDRYMEWNGTDLTITGAANIGGTITAGDGIESSDYVAGTTGWRIDGDGDAEFSSGTFRGALDAATGSFSGSITADTGAIGGWEILANEIRSANDLTRIRADRNRLQIDDAFGTVKVALGYLGSVPGHTSDEFGLYVADGNTVEFSSGATFEEGSYFINEDAAFVTRSGGAEAVRLGSLGSGDIGLDIGGMKFGETLGGGGASGTFGDTLGGGGSDDAFDSVLGGGNATWGSTSGLLYSLAEDKLYITGTLIAADGVFSGALSAATGTFSGALEAATGTFAGSLSAATGTFAGSLSAATGTFAGLVSGGSIDIGSGAFVVTSAGNLTATSGTFSGDVSGASGTFSGTIGIGVGDTAFKILEITTV